MNKIFKVVYSKARHMKVVVSEIAKSHSKSGTNLSKKILAQMLALGVLLLPSSASATNLTTLFLNPNNYFQRASELDEGNNRASFSAEKSQGYVYKTIMGNHTAATVTLGLSNYHSINLSLSDTNVTPATSYLTNFYIVQDSEDGKYKQVQAPDGLRIVVGSTNVSRSDGYDYYPEGTYIYYDYTKTFDENWSYISNLNLGWSRDSLYEYVNTNSLATDRNSVEYHQTEDADGRQEISHTFTYHTSGVVVDYILSDEQVAALGLESTGTDENGNNTTGDDNTEVNGKNNNTTGNKDKVTGDGNNTTGNDDTIKGNNNNTTGDRNTVEGDGNNTDGTHNTIIGDNNTTNGNENEVTGDKNNTTGYDNTVTGDENNTTGNRNEIDGNKNNTYGDDDKVLNDGENNNTVGNNDTIDGDDNTTSGNENEVTGDKNNTTGYDNAVVGDENNTYGNENKINGTGNDTYGNENEVIGDDNINIGRNNKIEGSHSTVIGRDSYVVASNAGAIGNNAVATESDVVSFGHSIGDPDGKGGTYTDDYRVRLTNVADAVNPNDAVNLAQLSSVEKSLQKGVAGAAALAALHPMEYDPDEKVSFAVGYGNYKSANSVAFGTFIRPNDSVMVSLGGAFGSGENSFNVGLSFKLGKKAYGKIDRGSSVSTVEILSQNRKLKAEVENLHAEIDQMKALMKQALGIEVPDIPAPVVEEPAAEAPKPEAPKAPALVLEGSGAEYIATPFVMED